MHPTDPPCSPKDVLPRTDDSTGKDNLKSGVLDQFHRLQPQVLEDTFRPPNYLLEQIQVSSAEKLYYDPHHTNRYKRPDWFAVVRVEPLDEPRNLTANGVTWQKMFNPFVVVELLSPETEREDLGEHLEELHPDPTKWEVYEQILHIPYYVVFDGKSDRLRVFQFAGNCYTELELREPRVWMNDIQLGLGLWQGVYQGLERLWLRWYKADGRWILTPEEREQEHARRLAQQLRDLGIEPDGNLRVHSPRRKHNEL
ncbi:MULTISPECIES: Uma2 family endonuclease [unclassified Coleofasciculus]|uniref:Uma2 family endonuclease n=1 Tax=unclassified Coleofasciculus TaxID=2692782 RepID=UPI001882B14E|nr:MULTISPECIES: Uma2 family endonuclease [unclassified Coleofasciculus]MBE9125147.1 Uma2 family endonuclease [Coleofasciculus sp. LEGE 07081]MBE9148364.1 Uma2 family endonuclease [Coleofasciculus sp. LEGE 07092]